MGFSESETKTTQKKPSTSKESKEPTAEEVGQLILKETDLTPEEIKEKTSEKLEEFEGLVTDKASACMLVAQDYNVNYNQKLKLERDTEISIEHLVEEMNSLRIKVEVSNIYDANEFERDDGSTGKVRNVIVKDSTGKTQLALWDDDASAADKLGLGEEIIIDNAYTEYSDYNDRVEIGIGDDTRIVRASDGETVLGSE